MSPKTISEPSRSAEALKLFLEAREAHTQEKAARRRCWLLPFNRAMGIEQRLHLQQRQQQHPPAASSQLAHREQQQPTAPSQMPLPISPMKNCPAARYSMRLRSKS